MAACCYVGVDLRNQLDPNFPSRLTDGTPYSSSNLLSSFLLLPSTWIKYSKSNFLSPFYSDKIIPSPNSLLSLLFLNKKTKHAPNLQNYSKTISFSALAANFFPIYKNILSFTFFPTHENSPFLLTHSMLLPLESKQCPLKPASVLACADAVDELWF